MTSELPLLALLAGLFMTAGLVPVLIWLAPRLHLVAAPNSRSSHVRPTPTGGGIAIALPIILWSALAPLPLGRDIAIAGGILAVVGVLDDVLDLPAPFRFVVQIACIAWFLTATWPQDPILVQLLAGVCVLWFVNLFNFMDGIDGIAASQAFMFCLGVSLLGGATLTWMESLVWLVAGSSFAFLLYNWSPAKIFMGDAGALLLGFCLPVIALVLHEAGDVPLVASMLLLTVFLFDATWTLCVRIVTGQRFTGAHRTHLYQRLAQAFGHARTTTGFMLYAGIYLLPLAWLARDNPDFAWWLFVPAILPLVLLSFRYRPGLAVVAGPEPDSGRKADDAGRNTDVSS